MDYQEWLDAVEWSLKTHFRGVTVSDIDDDALSAAFAAGTSPVAFAMQKPLPVKPPPDPVPVPASPPRVPRQSSPIAVVSLVFCAALMCAALWLGWQWLRTKAELRDTQAKLEASQEENRRLKDYAGELVNQYNGLVDRHNAMVDSLRGF